MFAVSTRQALLSIISTAIHTGCATLPAVYDLVVPSPVASVSAQQTGNRVAWTTTYGKDPKELGHYPIHLWIDRSGFVDLPAAHADCEVGVAAEWWDRPAKVEPLTHQVILYSSWIETGPPSEEHHLQMTTDRCVVFLAVPQDSPDRIVFYDQAGAPIDAHVLPNEVPILVPKRWGWLFLAPVMDIGIPVIWLPVVLVMPIVSLFD